MNDNAYPYIACTQINRTKVKSRHKGKKHLPNGRYYNIGRSYEIEKMTQSENYGRTYNRRPNKTFFAFPTVKHLRKNSTAKQKFLADRYCKVIKNKAANGWNGRHGIRRIITEHKRHNGTNQADKSECEQAFESAFALQCKRYLFVNAAITTNKVRVYFIVLAE